MSDEAGRAAAALSRIRWGHRLLGGYLAVSLVVLLVVAVLLRWDYFLITVVAWVLGCALLIGVTVTNTRALGPLRTARELPGVPQSHDFQPGRGASRLLFLVTLTIIAAVAALAGSIAEVSAANVPTRVTVDSCARHGRNAPVCQAHWQADGRTIQGQISWAVTVQGGSMVDGWYDPANPGAVFAADQKYFDAITIQSGTCMLVSLVVFLVLYLRYRRFRRPYLAYLRRRAAGATRAP
jgi:hypothetical protein